MSDESASSEVAVGPQKRSWTPRERITACVGICGAIILSICPSPVQIYKHHRRQQMRQQLVDGRALINSRITDQMNASASASGKKSWGDR